MDESASLWGDVISRLGLLPVGTVEDGLRYQVQTASVVLELYYRAFRNPPSVRVIVRPIEAEGSFLVAPLGKIPLPVSHLGVGGAASPPGSAMSPPGKTSDPSRWRTGDPAFDERVAILSGGRVLCPRLGAAERERLIELVAEIGAIVGAEESTLEPAITARFTNGRDAAAAIRDLMRLCARLAVDPPVEELLERWFQDDGAPMVTAAAARRVVERLPTMTEEQAEIACRLVLDRGGDNALTLLSLMPPFACVLAAWFKVGDPLDPRIGVRVIDAWRAGTPRPAARYLAWLLLRPGPEAAATTNRIWQTPGLAEDAGFVREFVRAVRREPPPGALPLLLQVQPRSSSLARRLAKALACYPSADVDRRLLEWLSASSGGIRAAAATALAERVALELEAGGRAERLEPVRQAAERSTDLMTALLEYVPQAHSVWLVPIRPHGEPDAIALIRRLGLGGTDVDDALLFWLDRGTLSVRLEAAAALGSAGSPKVLSALRDRASSWFSDGGVREACREAIEHLRRRAGGAGNLALATPLGGGLAIEGSDRVFAAVRDDASGQ